MELELRDFVRKALLDITSAVDVASQHNNRIAPDIESANFTVESYEKTLSYIDFDLAVKVIDSTDESAEVSGKAGIKVIGGGVGSSSSERSESSKESRIRFSVPVSLRGDFDAKAQSEEYSKLLKSIYNA